jgi:hypothetical protein
MTEFSNQEYHKYYKCNRTLYAVGVFIPFTLAQFGMVLKWFRERPKGWQAKLAVNTLGGTITFVD